MKNSNLKSILLLTVAFLIAFPLILMAAPTVNGKIEGYESSYYNLFGDFAEVDKKGNVKQVFVENKNLGTMNYFQGDGSVGKGMLKGNLRRRGQLLAGSPEFLTLQSRNLTVYGRDNKPSVSVATGLLDDPAFSGVE